MMRGYDYGYGGGYDGYAYGGYGMMSGGGWVMLALIGFLILVAVIFFIITLSNQSSNRKNKNGNALYDRRRMDKAMQILDERLARGEITIGEYEKIKATLTKRTSEGT